jgi:nitrile hydratase beta subunit-like protein
VADAVAPRFHIGDRVTVREAYPIGHVRTPYYVRGKHGVIERLCGAFPNPEELAYARSGLPAQPLYRVRFLQSDVWTDYAGQRGDVVEVEIYQHWLEPEEQAS